MYFSATLGEKKLSNDSLVSKYTILDLISQYFCPISQEQIYSWTWEDPLYPMKAEKNSEVVSQIREGFDLHKFIIKGYLTSF